MPAISHSRRHGKNKNTCRKSRTANPSNLICISCQSQSVSKHRPDNISQLALLNIRSLAGKSFIVNDFINKHKLDFMFLTETWLGQENSAAVLIETAPPNFSFFSEARIHKRGGGVATLFKDSFQCRQMFYGQFDSFEYVATQLKSPCRAILVTIYRPPKYNARFSDEFAKLLSIVCMDFDCVLLVGDFNIHVDNLTDGCAKELLNILDNFGLSQHVTESTHNRGHILDLIISKGLNIYEIVVNDVALSDHYCVSFKMTTSANNMKSEAEVIRKRYINDNTCALFTQGFTPSPTLPSALVDDLVNSFSSNIMTVIDSIAPIKTKVLSGRKKAPWRNATLVKEHKRLCRQAERRWRKNKLQVHYDIYKESLRNYNQELKNARQSYFSEIINRNSNNARTLFSVVDRLTNPTASLPPELLSNKSCNDFAAFFTNKILQIKQAVASMATPPSTLKNSSPPSPQHAHSALPTPTDFSPQGLRAAHSGTELCVPRLLDCGTPSQNI
ncbi:uncharacterized protein LOC115355565 [Myripristis murdjan]|uniref:uncharacterized protein LOC115355565 n=1 Tax=Myripristis murdjan TaxID=586833 RepID=UPI001175D385|nr:uncharacterized protein LOC115355565 [Myripristis murdjan]